jgi:protein-S-isoprenylcysteine O-methyltransferase Ste14
MAGLESDDRVGTEDMPICDRGSPNYSIALLFAILADRVMSQAETAQPQRQQQVPDVFVRLGGWLFRHRTALPLPIALILLLVPSSRLETPGLFWAGVATVSAGELLRLWAVRHIGVISRTRSDRLGPLVATGPFGLVRNPLYVGNMLLWIGFTVSARLLWWLPLIVSLLAFEYHAIVRWEEGLLESRLGDTYRDYAGRVPRWLPGRRASPVATGKQVTHAVTFSWSETLYSERGTLIAIAVGYLLLWLKASVST